MKACVAMCCLLVLAACYKTGEALRPGEDRPALESAVRYCAWKSACDLEDESASLDACLRSAAGERGWGAGQAEYRVRMDTIVNCLDNASGCVDFATCTWERAYGQVIGAPCNDRFGSICNGNVLTTCIYTGVDPGGVQLIIDCTDPAWGGRCVVLGDRRANCAADCTPGGIACDQDVALKCHDNNDSTASQSRVDCGADGLVCAADIGCVDGAGADCTEDACYGPLARQCAGGKPVTSDCRNGHSSFVCVMENGIVGCGLPIASRSCDPVVDGHATCIGNVASACVNGLAVTVDCAKVPGGTCEALIDGGARCIR